RYRTAMLEEEIVIGLLHCPERKQSHVVAGVPGQGCFHDRLFCRAADASDSDGRSACGTVALGDRLRGQLQYRLQKAMPRLADLKLRRVYSNGNAPGTSGVIISSQRALAAFIETALSRQR